jgi:hypothetical protein
MVCYGDGGLRDRLKMLSGLEESTEVSTLSLDGILVIYNKNITFLNSTSSGRASKSL